MKVKRTYTIPAVEADLRAKAARRRRALTTGGLLKTHLSLTVPYYITELERCGGPTDYQIEMAQQRGVANADHMMFGGAPMEAARLVDQLAEVIAILAFAPGGIEVLGMNFVAHNEGMTNDA